MRYNVAQRYSDIDTEQRDLEAAELQAVRDTTMSLGPFLNVADGDPNPTREEAALMKRQIEVLQGQLLLVDSYLQDMDRLYKKFLAQRVTESLRQQRRAASPRNDPSKTVTPCWP